MTVTMVVVIVMALRVTNHPPIIFKEIKITIHSDMPVDPSSGFKICPKFICSPPFQKMEASSLHLESGLDLVAH